MRGTFALGGGFWRRAFVHLVGCAIEQEGGGGNEVDDAGEEEGLSQANLSDKDAGEERAEGHGETRARRECAKDTTAQVHGDAFVFDGVEERVDGSGGESGEELDENDDFEGGVKGVDKVAEGEEDEKGDEGDAAREARADGGKDERADDCATAAGCNAQAEGKGVVEDLLKVDGHEDACVEQIGYHDCADDGEEELVLPDKVNAIEKFSAPVTARFFLYGGGGGADEDAYDGGGDEKGGGVEPEDGGGAERGNHCAGEGRADETGTAFDDLIH